MGERTDAEEHADADAGASEPSQGYLALLVAALKGMLAHDVPVLAAAIAFKIFLSLFPAAVAAVAVFSRVGDPTRLLGRARAVLPPEVISLLEDRVLGVAGTEGAGLIAVVGVLGGLWAASSAAATLVKALNRINGVTEARGFIGQRVVALAITFALLLALAAILALVVLGPQLRAWLLPEGFLGGAAGLLMQLVQSVAALAVLALLLSFVYWVGPNREERPAWSWWNPGALVGVVGWLLVSGGFSLYTQTAATYEATYAGLAGVIVTLLWLQLSMIALLLGAEVNAERVRHG